MALQDSFLDRAKRFLNWRSLAYRRVFDAENSSDARVVLTDLARFCRADKSTAHPEPAMAARLDGRREVWLRIQEHLHLTTAELYRLYNGQKDPGE